MLFEACCEKTQFSSSRTTAKVGRWDAPRKTPLDAEMNLSATSSVFAHKKTVFNTTTSNEQKRTISHSIPQFLQCWYARHGSIACDQWSVVAVGAAQRKKHLPNDGDGSKTICANTLERFRTSRTMTAPHQTAVEQTVLRCASVPLLWANESNFIASPNISRLYSSSATWRQVRWTQAASCCRCRHLHCTRQAPVLRERRAAHMRSRGATWKQRRENEPRLW